MAPQVMIKTVIKPGAQGGVDEMENDPYYLNYTRAVQLRDFGPVTGGGGANDSSDDYKITSTHEPRMAGDAALPLESLIKESWSLRKEYFKIQIQNEKKREEERKRAYFKSGFGGKGDLKDWGL